MSSPSMTEIARAAGVGKATVSLALRNDPRLRPETRQHIQEVAARMGYQANAVVANLMAQLRASRNPKFKATIGVLNASNIRDSLQTNYTFRIWLGGLRERAGELGYGVDEFWLHEPGIGPDRLRQILRARNIRGMIIAAVLDHQELPAEFDLLWEDLACVVLGIRPERPALHFACNDQFSTALHTARELEKLGYRQPGLVIDPAIESNIEHRFSAGFHAGRPADHPARRVPLLDFRPGGEMAFRAWRNEYQPDVIVCTHPEIRDWILRAGLRCPEDIGLVHLDLTPELEGWSGMRQNNDVVGAFAVDLVTGQLHRNEYGIPLRPKCMMTESEWVEGTTVRPQNLPTPRRGRRKPGG